jgi:outer membrane receptor protein involved in Fe transport
MSSENLERHGSPRNAALVLALLMAGIGMAQSVDAELEGVVKDPAAAAIPNATLTLTNEGTGVARTILSDAEGHYRFYPVPPGRYSLKVAATGFATSTVTGLDVSIGMRVNRDIPLEVGGTQEAVTVTGEVPIVDTSKSEVSGVVNSQQINDLPINTRQYLNLALLLPGTSQDSSRTFYNSVQMGGASHYWSNGFTVDGVTNTWAEMGEPRQNFPMGAVEEFKVNTMQYNADQGGFSVGGVVNIVTRTGTNQFHGEAFDYVRNAIFNRDDPFTQAADAQVGLSRAPYRRNQYGGDIGGPIVRNKLHFYVAYERTQQTTSFNITLNPAVVQDYGVFQGVHSRPQHDQMFNTRVDYKLTNDQLLFARYSQEWNLITWNGCGASTYSSCYDGQIPRHSLVVGHTWTPSATVVNEARFQYAYSSYQLGPSGVPIFTQLGQYPSDRIAQLQTQLNFPSFTYGFGYSDVGVETRWEGKDDVSIVKGKHTIKFGIDVNRVPFGDDAPAGDKGTYTFAHDHYFNPNDPASLAALAASNDALTFTATLPPVYTRDDTTELGLYIQDEWKVRRNLTVNLGLRWDREFGTFDENLSLSDLAGRPFSAIVPIPGMGDPSKRGSKKDFGPRVGLAWDVLGNSKNVFRAGYGIYYANIQTLQNFPELRDYSQCAVLINKPAYPDPYGGQTPTQFCSTAAPSPTILDPKIRNPYSQQFNFGYSRVLAREFSVHVDGVYEHTVHDYRVVDLNFPVNGVRPYPQFNRILDHDPIGRAKYTALYVRAEKRFARRYQFLVSYTFARNEDDNAEAQVTTATNYGLDWGPANADRRHNLVASGIVQLPAGFTFGAVWTVRSALPFSAFSNTTDADGIRQFVPGTTRNQGNRNLNMDIVNGYRATLGLAPITSIDSSRYNGLDFRLTRPFRIKGERSIELGIQVFDVFGTENLGVPSGQMTAGGNTTITSSPNFGRILGVLNNTLQQAELSAKLKF